MRKPVLVCLDLEGVLVPEIWINVALKTGIEDLKITTREMPDYHKLMERRLKILDQHQLKIHDIQGVIAQMGPLDGAMEFVAWLRDRYQVVILSDTFYQFAEPLMRQLGFPTLFCNQLEIDGSGRILAYHMRMKDPKKHAVAAFKSLNFLTMAAGDSYNDTAMLGEADAGFSFARRSIYRKNFHSFQLRRRTVNCRDDLPMRGQSCVDVNRS